MGPILVGVMGTLLGVLLGGALQQLQATRARRWQQEDALKGAKRAAFAEYLRSISASYAQAMSGVRSRSEDASIHAATAQIEVLCGVAVAGPARELTDMVINVHSEIAAGTGVAQEIVDTVNQRRYEVIDLFKTDVGLPVS
ncbi:hypothetical protein OHA72_48400 [Dactylosporangium sp. NBC_01737]|uniref:hypothetical protein n=1 Tax=Dactylosporangium sp. NBC_01737 TaxID=2975959 RepID=UPI002E10FB94|nr:hypothetical protein OHA72_48400 [Dactylosporangium sp. NBC_01737]